MSWPIIWPIDDSASQLGRPTAGRAKTANAVAVMRVLLRILIPSPGLLGKRVNPAFFLLRLVGLGRLGGLVRLLRLGLCLVVTARLGRLVRFLGLGGLLG